MLEETGSKIKLSNMLLIKTEVNFQTLQPV